MNNLAYKLPNQEAIKLGSLNYNPAFQVIYTDQETIALRYKLNQVLRLLSQRRQQVVTREELINQIWAGNHYIGERALTHTICKLRRIFEQLGCPELRIITIPKTGYCLL